MIQIWFSVINKYLSYIYTKNLNLLIFKAEKDSIFSYLLINKEKNIKEKEIYEIIRKIIKKNLENYF